jgi:carboxyl-terminal processing protease
MSQSRRNPVRRTAAALTAVVMLAFISVLGVAWFQKARAVQDDTYQYLELFNQVLGIVQQDYVKEVKTKDLIYGAIRGMLATLDPHSVFLTKEDFDEMKGDISGEFGGLGIEISVKNGWIVIISPIEDSPAWKAGLKADDLIVEIEGQSTHNMSINDAVHQMRGQVGTPVTIKIMREGFDEPKAFTIVRDRIEVKSIKQAKLMSGDIAYLKCVTFTDNTDTEARAGLNRLAAQAKNGLKGIILDLRNNPGGPLDQAIRLSDMFISEGVIVSVTGRVEKQPPAYAHKAGTIDNVPMVVLANQHSASASEIVAGALQDHGRAVIMGKTTFGKGSVQQLLKLKDDAGLKITTAYYYTPSGRSIQEQGITPDIAVDEFSPQQKAKLKEAEKSNVHYLREKDLQGHFSHEDAVGPESGDSAAAAPEKDEKAEQEAEKLLPKKVGEDTDDYQLQRALDLLRSFEIFHSVLSRKAG